MKKLIFYFLISLFFITKVSADQIAVVDIKLGTKLTDYFTTAQISKYNINDAQTDTPWYSYDGKYSWIMIDKKENIYEDDYDFIQIMYANKNDEINSISSITDYQFDHSEGLNECIKYRSQKISQYKQKKILKGLKEYSNKFTSETGGEMKADAIYFDSPPKYYFGFICAHYPERDDTDFRLSYTTYEFEEWKKY